MKCNVISCKFNNLDGTCGAREVEIVWKEIIIIGDCDDIEAPVCDTFC